jgi:hypothetical protein
MPKMFLVPKMFSRRLLHTQHAAAVEKRKKNEKKPKTEILPVFCPFTRFRRRLDF